MKKFSDAETAHKTLTALAAKGLAPTALNFLNQYRDITGESAPALETNSPKAQTEQILTMMKSLLEAVSMASSNLQQDLALFHTQSREMIMQVSSHADPDTAGEIFHALSASASWLLSQVGATRHELANTRRELMVVRNELADAQQLAATDPLTELPNRRGLDLALTHEMARARRSRSPLSVAILDLDHFKQVNDQHGHAVGDFVLRQVTAVMKQRLRATDICARYGGEEFAVILPDTALEGSEIVLSRLLEGLKGTPAVWEDQRITVSFSAGVTQWNPGESAQVMLDRADHALYSAKRSGRGCVVAAAVPVPVVLLQESLS